mgnify:CR=1 FL=1
MNYINILVVIRSNLRVYIKIISLFKMKKVSDPRKEKILLSYSKSLFISSMKILFIILIIVGFIYILNLFSNTLFNAILSFTGIAQLSTIFIIYHLIRKKIYAKL